MPSALSVILDEGVLYPLDYAAPDHLIKVGTRVRVPLQKRVVKGTVIAIKESDTRSLKPIVEALEEFFPPDLFELGMWMAHYYATPLGKVFQVLLPPSVRKGLVKAKVQQFVRPLVSLNQLREECEKLRMKHAAQAKVLDALLQSPKGLLLSELLEIAEVSQSPIQTLSKRKVLEIFDMTIERSPILDQDFFPTKAKKLGEEQQQALDKIRTSLEKNALQVHLLHGVTGSGKTEVYLQAIDAALKSGKSVIWLVPEIALTSQMIERLKGRFQQPLAVLHHRLSQGERYDAWQQIRSGRTRIILGARSAIFSPTPLLGLIIVDEEHEPSYKQSDDSPKYHARDVAVMRGKLAGATVVLGSATPSLESYTNALGGKYILSELHKRADKALLPNVKIIDMRPETEKARGFTLFSEALIDGIKQRIKNGEQTLLFLNRRGYHTSAVCQKCSYIVICPHCDISLTYHLGSQILACHLCDYRIPPPRTCPSCKCEDALKFKGAGTEMVQRALHALLPDVRTLRLDADTTRHKGSHEQLFKQFRAGKADVLIGTQMIAKGLHFSLVTLVGILAADASLGIPDFRAAENVFQLLTQVAGRSGRGELAGEVIIQTRLPDHPTIVLASKQDYRAFYEDEIKVRELFHYPPFTHLIKLTFASKDSADCLKEAEKIRSSLINALPPSVEINPVIPCGYAKIKEMYRFQCLIKTKSVGAVVEYLAQIPRKRPDLRISIDVDPVSTYF